MSFSLDIKKFAEKAAGNADRVVRKVVIELGTSIIKRSPVGNPALWTSLGASYRFMNKAGTKRLKSPVLEFRRQPPPGYSGGHFRANWQLGINTLPTGEIEGEDKTGNTTIAKIKAGLPAKASGGTYYITNNLPYAQALEDGHSTQAPSGMVALAAVEFQSFVDKAVGELK